MEHSKALIRLIESADLVKMLEDIIASERSEKMSSSSMAGIKVTLRTVREAILDAHDQFAHEVITRARSEAPRERQSHTRPLSEALQANGLNGDGNRGQIQRRDLRNTIEKPL